MRIEKLTKAKTYERFPERDGRLQKLLYFRPGATTRPICELAAVRDAEKDWLDLAKLGISDADEQASASAARLRAGLGHHAGASRSIRAALEQFNQEAA